MDYLKKFLKIAFLLFVFINLFVSAKTRWNAYWDCAAGYLFDIENTLYITTHYLSIVLYLLTFACIFYFAFFKKLLDAVPFLALAALQLTSHATSSCVAHYAQEKMQLVIIVSYLLIIGSTGYSIKLLNDRKKILWLFIPLLLFSLANKIALDVHINTVIYFDLFGVMLSVVLILLLSFCALVVRDKDTLKNISLSCSIFFVMLWMVETGYRLTDKYDLYQEKNKRLHYASCYRDLRLKEAKFTYSDYEDRYLTVHEFGFQILSNRHGLNEEDIEQSEIENKEVIFCLGDSYTDGMGAQRDSSWPRLLEKKLLKHNENFKVINAGISGSDPYYQARLFDKLYDYYQPKVAVFAINSSDIADFVRLGGQDRMEKKRQKLKEVPWWEFIYGASHVVRSVVWNYRDACLDNLAEKENEAEGAETLSKKEKEQIAINQIIQVLIDFKRQHDVEVYVAYLPFHTEIKEVENPMEGLLSALEPNGIHTIDLRYQFREALTTAYQKEYIWPIDGHYTGKGYDVTAEGIYKTLKATLAKEYWD